MVFLKKKKRGRVYVYAFSKGKMLASTKKRGEGGLTNTSGNEGRPRVRHYSGGGAVNSHRGVHSFHQKVLPTQRNLHDRKLSDVKIWGREKRGGGW